MNGLSITAINDLAAYEVSEVSEGCYQFFTNYGVHCSEGSLV